MPMLVAHIGNAALIKREAVTLPMDHAFGFELADVGPAAIEMQRQFRRADGLSHRSFLLRRGRIAISASGGKADETRTCHWLSRSRMTPNGHSVCGPNTFAVIKLHSINVRHFVAST